MTDWKERVLRETDTNNRRLLHLILRAVLGRRPPRPPAFGPTCVITPDGYVLTNAIHADGTPEVGFCLGTTIQVRDQLRALADVLDLSDEDRVAMFAEFGKWVAVDNRAIFDRDDPLNHLSD